VVCLLTLSRGRGFGRQMIGTHMVIMWENGHGTTLSQRYAKGYREPEPVDVPPWVSAVVQPTQMTVRRSTSVSCSMIVSTSSATCWINNVCF